MASLSRIAEYAGVSKSTVSLVLNNKPHVSSEMRERIMKAVGELSPNRQAPVPRPEENANVLLVHPLSMGSHQVFRELLQGVRSAVVQEGRGQLTLAAHDPPLRPDHATSALIHDPALRPDGVIVMAAAEDDPIIAEAQEEDLPCVLLARQHAPQAVSIVGMDNAGGARKATEYLLANGHTSIALLGGDEHYDYTELRIQGYQDAMKSSGCVPEIHLGNGVEATRSLLSGHRTSAPLPSAVFYINDEHALHGMRVLAEHGIRIPRDMSVIGFDDSDNALECSPQLTTVRVPRFLIGKLAGRTVMDHIRYPELDQATILLHTELIVRESVIPLESQNVLHRST